MLFEKPQDDVLYTALCSRDLTYEGRAWVGVTSTGIFCRLSCPARKPNPENCEFYDAVADCLQAGFRPCKRCKPLATGMDADPAVAVLVHALEADPGRRWGENDVVLRGFDPSTIRRAFKRHYGVTFLEMARLARIRHGAQAIAAGDRVIDAQQSAGFDSGSGFRAAFARVLGTAPQSLKQGRILRANWLDTPIGPMIAVADSRHLMLLEFFERKSLGRELKALQTAAKGSIGLGTYPPIEQIKTEMQEYFAGDRRIFETPLAAIGTPFTQSVWAQLRSIPVGVTQSYSDVARDLGRPTATRAVARANGANPIAIVVPCHRVIGADGSLTGYGGGIWRKQWLIRHEAKMAR